jgi:hypothetical protein
MFEMIVSAPMCTRSGNRSDATLSSVEGSFGKAAPARRTPPMTPRKPSRANLFAFAQSMKLAVGLLMVASAANAGPGLVAEMTKSTSANAAAIASYARIRSSSATAAE